VNLGIFESHFLVISSRSLTIVYPPRFAPVSAITVGSRGRDSEWFMYMVFLSWGTKF
jgi:hypothetical protein